ncbi:MAG: hypothetical protein KUG65_08490 [Sphingomonadaceae bacterium]|nr:hypothetical protein [Sphingomonadaceae bacterium]
MTKLLPYGDTRNSNIVAKIGGHGGGKLQTREVGGKVVTGIKRTASSDR